MARVHCISNAVFSHSLRHDRVEFDDAKLEPTEVLVRVRERGLFLLDQLACPFVRSGADHLGNVHQAVDQKATDAHSQELRPITRPFFRILHVLSRDDAACMEIMV